MKKTTPLISRLFRLGMENKKWFTIIVILSVFLACATTYRPYLTMIIVDQDITKLRDKDLVLHDVLILTALVLFETVLNLVFVYASNLISQEVIKKLRERLFQKLLYFRTAFFDKTPVGQLVTRAVGDVETISTVYKDGFLMLFGDVLKIVFVLIMMFAMDIKLSLISLLLMPIMLLVTRYFQKRLKKAFGDERNFTAQQNSFVQERLAGMSIIQVFNRQEAEFAKFETINKKLESALLRTVFIFSLFFPVVELVSSVFLGLILFYGGFVKVSAGVIIAFIQYINMLVRPLRQIADRFNNIQRGLVGAERVFGLIDDVQALPNEGQLRTDRLEGKLEFQDVVFSYEEKTDVLKGVSFLVQPGETTAIVGATGAGKTTIISLVTRLYDIQSGKILIDNHDIREYDMFALRRKIGVVIQDVFLFQGSVLDNIRMDSDISLKEIRKAAQDIGVDDMIMQLPGEYDYIVSERGASLSMGQRQLISFLRVMVTKPDMLVLDEATSSIDMESEKLIQRATEKITQGRTSIIIAHRLSTIENANKIIVMHQGRILEIGTHKELLEKKGQYHVLYNSQEFLQSKD